MSSQGTLHQIFPSLALLRKQRASCRRQTTWDDLVSLSEPSGWGDKKKSTGSQRSSRTPTAAIHSDLVTTQHVTHSTQLDPSLSWGTRESIHQKVLLDQWEKNRYRGQDFLMFEVPLSILKGTSHGICFYFQKSAHIWVTVGFQVVQPE